MCLVMDRKEAKNALSVQMVGVSRSFSLDAGFGPSAECWLGDARGDSQDVIGE